MEVWIVETFDKRGRTTFLVVYEVFEEAMKEATNFLLSGEVIRVSKHDVHESFAS